MNEERGNHLSVEGVRLLRAADNRAERHVLVMKKEVAHQRGFTRAAAANEDYDGILGNLAHVKLLQ